MLPEPLPARMAVQVIPATAGTDPFPASADEPHSDASPDSDPAQPYLPQESHKGKVAI